MTVSPPAVTTPAVTAPAVTARHVSHTYPARRRAPARRALDDVSFTVPAGGVFGFLGPNGSGKSTLFRRLATLLPAGDDGGTLTVAGHDVDTEPLAVRRALGVAFQSPALDPRLTVAENLRHAGHLYGLSGAALNRRIGAVLDRFSLAARRGDRVGTLSGGLARRVELAKTLLHEPRVLLLDEPSTGLDPRARRRLGDLLAELAAGGVSVLLTTHFIEEAERCDRLLLLHQGRVAAQGTPQELKRSVGGEVVTLATGEPAALAVDVDAALGDLGVVGRAAAESRGVRIELARTEGGAGGAPPTPDLHALDLVARLARRIAGWESRVAAVTIARPTLEDVFLDRTGEQLGDDAPTATEGGSSRR